MTEQEWLECRSPDSMLNFLLDGELRGGSRRLLAEAKLGKRRLRLFACACCRRIWHVLPDEYCRNVVEVAERFADGCATEQELVTASDAVAKRITEGVASVAYFAKHAAAWVGKPNGTEYREEDVCNAAVMAASFGQEESTIERNEHNVHCRHLRDIFGNPFRPVAVAPAWQTVTVTSLAKAIYDERAYDRMPILADALEDTGCASQEILAHCRGPEPHVRGCWVVDLLLGKGRP